MTNMLKHINLPNSIAAAVTETRTAPSTAIKRPEGCILGRNVMEKQREEPNILLYYVISFFLKI